MYNCAHIRSTKEGPTVEYLEEENIFFVEEKKKWRRKGGKYLEMENGQIWEGMQVGGLRLSKKK